MEHLHDILIAVGMVVITFLITYFLTSISKNKNTVSIVKEALEIHIKVLHAISLDDAISKHSSSCQAGIDMETIVKKMQVLQASMIWIIYEMKGNPKDLGLIP